MVCHLRDRVTHVTLPTAWLEATSIALEKRNTLFDCVMMHLFDWHAVIIMCTCMFLYVCMRVRAFVRACVHTYKRTYG